MGLEHLRQAQDIVPIVSVQNRYSVTARDSEAVLQACAEQGVGFIPWFPLDAGRVAADGLAEIASRTRRDPEAGRARVAPAALA